MTESFNALVIGDLHFKANNIKQIEPLMEQCLKHARELAGEKGDKLDIIVVLGDTLDGHNKIDMRTMNRATRFLLKLSQITETYVLIGNHDRPNNSEYLTSEHPFLGLEIVGAPEKNHDGTYKNRKYKINIVRQPSAIKLGDSRIILAPYVPNGKFDISLATIPVRRDNVSRNFNINTDLSKVRVLFAHQEFRGCEIGKMKSSKGDDWPKDRPLVISGHIHKHHSPQENIFYVGTPYQLSYDDIGKKGIFFFKFYEKTQEVQHIELSIPEKKTITIKDKNLPDPNTLDNVRILIEDPNVDKMWLNEVKKYNKVIVKSQNEMISEDIEAYDDIVRDILKNNKMAIDIYNEL